MIYDSVLGCIGRTPIVRLSRLFPDPGIEVLAKLELLNPGGSIKDRPALRIVEEGLRSGTLRPGAELVESSSGNFGIALAMAGLVYGIRVTIVVDPTIAPSNLLLLRRYGATVELVTEADPLGGYLHSRLRRVRDLLAANPRLVWTNQYANPLNPYAHEATGQEIVEAVGGRIDYLFAAVSTSGTIHGVARGLRRHHPDLTVVAVDAVGSVIFGGPPGPRRLPGIGAGRVPELLRVEEIDDLVRVTDDDAVAGCHELLAREGILAGASSGSVVAALRAALPRLARPARIVIVLPDRGERYLDLVFGEPSSTQTGTAPASLSPAGSRP